MLTNDEPFWFADIMDCQLQYGNTVPPSQWQSKDVTDVPHMAPIERLNVTLPFVVMVGTDWAQQHFKPNLPWAEDHFQERVGGEPLNPPPSEAWWPFRVQGNQAHKEVGDEKFSHTYPERMWPRVAGEGRAYHEGSNWGVRYKYGDLSEVVNQLSRNPLTRQAYLPIWFPEDTGAVDGQRVPCTLGYHFMIREDKAYITYYMRSCDILRHLKDDAYMAARLLQWVVEKLQGHGIDVRPYSLVMHVASLHIFEGDRIIVERFLEDYNQEGEYGYGV